VTADTFVPVDRAQIDLRGDPSILPFEPPEPNTVTTWNGRDVLWLGPDGWLVVGDRGTEGAIERELQSALAGQHHSIVDVSANRTVFDLTDGLDQLASGCGLDLDPSRWRPGMCAQTLFGGAQVILHQLDERTTRVFVRPSFTGYVMDRLRTTPSITS
jgi:sarcosine oxidase subunit gamma